jgi:hypothetical protein
MVSAAREVACDRVAQPQGISRGKVSHERGIDLDMDHGIDCARQLGEAFAHDAQVPDARPGQVPHSNLRGEPVKTHIHVRRVDSRLTCGSDFRERNLTPMPRHAHEVSLPQSQARC